MVGDALDQESINVLVMKKLTKICLLECCHVDTNSYQLEVILDI